MSETWKENMERMTEQYGHLPNFITNVAERAETVRESKSDPESEPEPVVVKPRLRVRQPQAIINDAEKAIGMWEDKSRIPDRFGDDIDNIQFWVNMAKIQHAQLKRTTGLSPVKRGS